MSQQRPVEIAKFDELDDSWVQTGGLATRCIFVGARNSPDAPVGIAMRGDRDLGDFVGGKRSFDTYTLTVVLSGTVMHDGKWMDPGELYFSPPNEPNGDLLFGPEGGVIFIMFGKRSGMIPKFVNPKDQEKFDSLLRKDVEDVASGNSERSVCILPLREETTRGRAIVYTTTKEVAQYRKESGIDW